MRITFLISLVALLLAPVAAAEAEKVVDGKSGLVVAIPDGWDRDERQEKGHIRFASVYDLAPKRYVLFRVEAGPAANFDPAAWLANEKAALSFLKSVDQPFKSVSGARVGGLAAAAYTAAGKVAQGSQEYDLHMHVRGVVRGSLFFRISELSYNNAHTEIAEPLEAMWNGISFQDGSGGSEFGEVEGDDGADEGDGSPGGGEGGPGALAAPGVIEDKEGNFKITLPEGWEVVKEPPEGDDQQRIAFTRKDEAGNALVFIDVWKFTETNPEIFSLRTPGDVLKMIQESGNLFEMFFGDNTRKLLRPQVDESVLLGGAEKSGAYTYKMIKPDEQKQIDEAQKLVNRGDKSVTVPKFLPVVVRGRLAMISPHIYLVRAEFRRSVADKPELVSEYNKVLDTWEFLETGALPPPHPTGVGNTRDDPANAKPRKEVRLYTERARKTYNLEIKFTVPPGFTRFTKGETGNRSVMLLAQDDKNNWMQIEIINASARVAGEENKVLRDPKEYFEEWASNWESKARGVKVPRKPARVRIGRLSGKGYKELEGKVENFKGTFTAFMDDKSGWRTIVRIETRGKGHEVFEDGLKDFAKSVKIRSKK